MKYARPRKAGEREEMEARAAAETVATLVAVIHDRFPASAHSPSQMDILMKAVQREMHFRALHLNQKDRWASDTPAATPKQPEPATTPSLVSLAGFLMAVEESQQVAAWWAVDMVGEDLAVSQFRGDYITWCKRTTSVCGSVEEMAQNLFRLGFTIEWTGTTITHVKWPDLSTLDEVCDSVLNWEQPE